MLCSINDSEKLRRGVPVEIEFLAGEEYPDIEKDEVLELKQILLIPFLGIFKILEWIWVIVCVWVWWVW